jgi:hypothetical protein
MVLWTLLAVETLLVGTNGPFVNESLRITSPSIENCTLVIAVAFVATFWIELKKLLKR